MKGLIALPTMTCDHCKKQTKQDAFCHHCGIALKCPQCQTTFHPQAKYCLKCGTRRQGAAIETEQLPNVQHTNENDITHSQSENHAQEKRNNLESESPHNLQNHFQRTPNKETYHRRKFPPVIIGVLIAALVFIIIIFSGNFKNPEVEIEKTITQYFRAVENLDYQTVLKLYHPDSPYVEDIQEFLETPKNLNIEIHGFYDLKIVDNYAEVTTLITLSSLDFNEPISNELYFTLTKERKNWYIYDVY